MDSSHFIGWPCSTLARPWLLACLLCAGCCRLGADETSGAPASAAAPAAATSGTPVGATAPSPQPAQAKSTGAAEAARPPERDIAGAAHILITYKGAEQAPGTVTRTKEAARARAQEAFGKLKAGTTFEELVKEYSDDGSKVAAGAIGNFERNAMPAAFSEATFAMKVGEVSEVVETPRGFHIIRRTK